MSYSATIRSKLIAIILIVAMLTIVPICVLSGWLQYRRLKKDLAENTLVKARLVGEYCISPLIFEDRFGAMEILNKMAYVPTIQSSMLFDKQGNLFALFHRDAHGDLATPETFTIPRTLRKEIESGNTRGKGLFIGDTFCISVPVRYQGETYGSLFIQAGIHEIYRKTVLFYLTLFPGMVLSLGLALFLAIRLQKKISGPIIHLADVTHRITKKGDVSIRVTHPAIDPNSPNEIDQLYSGFNTMLERLAERNSQLHQAQKMESVGRLAGGVAHDFNNILSVIMGHADLCLMDIDESHMLFESINTIRNAGDRAARLTQQLLAFSRKQMIKQEVLDVGKEIDELLKMLGRLLGEDIDIDVHHGGDDFFVKADRSQLEQLILNLSINARDAMPEGGRLTIQTDGSTLEEETMGHHFLIDPGEYIQICVSDTGEGISHEMIGNIFEPFFTTKEKGKGTGLGLSTVYGIVKQNKGAIDVQSRPGEGSTFFIYLPRVFQPVAHDDDPRHSHPAGNQGQGKQTILLVEDDDMLRKMLYYTLSDQGFTLIQATNGEEARTMFDGHDGRINLLISDVVMPGKNGVALASELTLLSPDLKVILMSGYTEHAMIDGGIAKMGFHFIHKPVTPKTILKAIHDLFNA